MRIHLQSPENDPLFVFTPEQWEAAAGHAANVSAGHVVSIGETERDFAAAIGAAEAVVTDVAGVRKYFPVDAPRLKLVLVTSAGLDRLAPFDWLPNDVALLNNRGTHERKAGEFGIMSVLMLANRVPEFVTLQRAGRWEKLYGRVLLGLHITVVGLGSLGGAVARQAQAFGMRVAGVRTSAAPHPHCAEVVAFTDIDRVLPETDVLLLACPLTKATQGLIDRRRLGLLPAGAGVVNIGRGALIDQEALCDALDDGRLSGAVLDVFEPEPIPQGHRLWTTRNLIISPHTSVDDPRTYNVHTLDILFQNLRAMQNGEPLPHRFDTVRGY